MPSSNFLSTITMSGPATSGKVSIIITNFNGLRWLKPCLDSVRQQEYKNFEVVFVDNHSTDTSVALVRSHYPEVVVIENSRDEGFAGGNNIGVGRSTGEYVLLLNTDTVVPPTLLSDLLRAFDEIPNVGVVQPKLFFLYDPSKLDSCGSNFSYTGFLQHIGNQKNAALPEYNRAFPVFAVKGACLMFRRDLLDKTGGLFDKDYYCYFEETDFCLRVWLAGYECWYYPKANIRHAMGGVTGRLFPTPYVQYHSFKNRLTTYLKNFSAGTLWHMLPAYALFNVLVSVSFLATGNLGNCAAVYKAMWYNLKHLKQILQKRKHVQSHVRVVADKTFLPRVTGSISFHQLFRYAVYLLMYERRQGKMVVPKEGKPDT